jgi:tRNA-dihydrouridine synthase B
LLNEIHRLTFFWEVFNSDYLFINLSIHMERLVYLLLFSNDIMKGFMYMLAPLEDITGNAFRNICHKYGADLTFTELARIDGLARGNESTIRRITLRDSTPTVIQFLGSKEGQFGKFLKDYEPCPGFIGFNLNLGCPSPQVIALGQGSAMVKRISKVKKIMGVFKDFGYRPSIKMRLGLNQYEKERRAYLNLIDAVDPEYFIVHARHAAQRYEEPADFSVYEACVKSGKAIIANGDIKTVEQIDYLKSIGVKGAMIGRKAVIDPCIFNRLKGKACPEQSQVMTEYMALSEKYGEPFKYSKNFSKHQGSEPFPQG